MGNPVVVGLDVSADRIAMAVCDSVSCDSSWVAHRKGQEMTAWVKDVGDDLSASLSAYNRPATCLEINLHPRLMHKGHMSQQMVAAYMRSRWVEGMLLLWANLSEPAIIRRQRGGHFKVPGDHECYALQASSGKNAKEQRRQRMAHIYGVMLYDMSQDEIDALAVAHDCSIALGMHARLVKGRG
jgi:hypothetical protein